MKGQRAKRNEKNQKTSKKTSGKATPGKWDEMNRKQRREMMRQMQSGDLNLEVIHPDASGIDIGNESHYVAVPRSRDSQPVRCFGCTTAELKKMAEWLTQCGIRTVAPQHSFSKFLRLPSVRLPPRASMLQPLHSPFAIALGTRLLCR
jgi:hypothetical protein